MDRRQFLKLAAGAPLMLNQQVEESAATEVWLKSGNGRRFPTLAVKGTYREIGHTIGEQFGSYIRQLIRRRAEWHTGLLTILQSESGRRYSHELLRLSRQHFPHLIEELEGMAEGAGMHFDAVWAMTIKSELGVLEQEIPGCSTVYVGSGKKRWLCHNEDGDSAYAGLMFVVKVSPPSGVDFISLAYPGILTGNGPSMNNRGIVQTTNYIAGTGAVQGLPRYVIGRAILEAENLEAARQIATLEPRAYPYHHNLAGTREKRFLSVETVPGKTAVATPKGIFVHTNHLLHRATKDYGKKDGTKRSSSSVSRFSVLRKLAKKVKPEDVTQAMVMEWMSSHANKPHSPCRHPEGDVSGQTLGTAFFDIDAGSFRLYKHNPCTARPMGAWMELEV